MGKTSNLTFEPSSGGYRSIALSNFHVKISFVDYLKCLQKNNNVGICFEIRVTNLNDLIGVVQINGRDNNDRALPYLDDKFDNESKRIKKIWLSSSVHLFKG